LQNESYLPTDATAFYLKGVPILSAFTGAHADYHTPRDTADKINFPEMARITQLFARIMEGLEAVEQTPDYQEMKKPENLQARAGMRIYLGTIPDFSRPDTKGVALAGAAKGGPADKAGIQKGDIIVELAGKKIENIYDYTYAMGLLKIGEPTPVVVQRGTEQVKLTIVPAARE
jgi:S1-C subfamily serine protease